MLVPVEKFERMQKQLTEEQPSVLTAGDEASRIDAQMHGVLNSANKKNEREKAIEFSQLLRKYLLQTGVLHADGLVAKKLREYDTDEHNESVGDNQKAEIDSIVRFMPKTYKNAARALLEHLLENGKVRWNYKKQLIYRSKAHESMNIVDLLNDCVKRKKLEAKGINFFIIILKEIHTPLSLISNPTVKERLSKNVSANLSDILDAPGSSSTPKKNLDYSFTDDDDDESTLEGANQTWKKIK